MFMDVSSYFRGKRITVMGLGVLGRGVGDTHYLAECGADLIVTDIKSREDLAESVEKLKAFKNIKFVLGEHRLEDFRDRDFILKSAGVPLDSPYIAEAKKNGIPVRMSADLFMELSGIKTIGITGTRGKSTVAHLVNKILKEAGLRILLGGNVRGVSTLSLLPFATPEHVAILELDSWQCQGLGESALSPDTAIFTTFYPDHLNYYKNDIATYLADKSNIFLYQNPEDTLIIGSQYAPALIETYGKCILGKTIIAGKDTLPQDWELKIPGEHNRYDAGIALALARSFGIEDTVSQKAIETFTGVPGRLELIAEKDGIKIYNDTTATTPEATSVAISALSDKGSAKSIILIMGGTDKDLEMDALIAKLADVKRVVLLSGTGTERIISSLPKAPVFKTLKEAVEDSFSHAERGDTILFSPAFASFGMFKNEFDRGDQFVQLVQEKLA